MILKEKCAKTPHCFHLKELLDKCNERVSSGGSESCISVYLLLILEI